MARGDVEDNGANWRSSEGRRFHRAGAVWQKDLFVTWRWEGFEGRFRVTREEERVEREWFRLTSEWRYAGRLELRVLYVRESTLCWILSFILSQWRYLSIGVIWWNLQVLLTAQAAELRTNWRLFVWVDERLSRGEVQQSNLEWTNRRGRCGIADTSEVSNVI